MMMRMQYSSFRFVAFRFIGNVAQKGRIGKCSEHLFVYPFEGLPLGQEGILCVLLGELDQNVQIGFAQFPELERIITGISFFIGGDG